MNTLEWVSFTSAKWVRTKSALTQVAAVAAGGFASGAVQSGNMKGGVRSAFQALATFGVGRILPGAGSAQKIFSKAHAIHTLAHGIVGGVFSVLGGGKFGHGFATAGTTALFSPVVGDMGNGPARVMAAAILGGSVSTLAGGKFSNGAVTAAFVQAFNHELQPAMKVSGKVQFVGATVKRVGTAPDGTPLFDSRSDIDIPVSAEFKAKFFDSVAEFWRSKGITIDLSEATHADEKVFIVQVVNDRAWAHANVQGTERESVLVEGILLSKYSTYREINHEFAHALGLRDLYDRKTMLTLKDEYRGSIMANSGGMDILPFEMEAIITRPLKGKIFGPLEYHFP